MIVEQRLSTKKDDDHLSIFTFISPILATSLGTQFLQFLRIQLYAEKHAWANEGLAKLFSTFRIYRPCVQMHFENGSRIEWVTEDRWLP